MAQWTGRGSHNSNYLGTLTVTERSYDVSNNTSTVDYSLTLRGENSTYFQLWTLWWTVTINGTQVQNNSQKISMDEPSGGISTYAVCSGSVTIPHNADGSKTISCSATMRTDTDAYNVPGSINISGGNLTLTTIPRASSMTTPDVFVTGSAGSISITSAVDTFKHKIDYFFGNTSGEAVALTANRTVSWTPPMSLLTEIPTNLRGVGILRLYTYSGGSLIGSKDYPLTIEAGASAKPSCSLTVSDSTTCLSSYGSYVQGQSRMAVSIGCTLSYGSPIRSYSLTVDGKTYTTQEVTNIVLQLTGARQATAYVTDARGRSSDVATFNYNCLAYVSPVVTLTANRCTAAGSSDSEGEYFRISMTASITSLNSANSARFVGQYKRSTDTSWTGFSGTGTSYTSGVISCTAAATCDIEVTVTDDLTGTTAKASVPPTFVLMEAYKTGKGISLGKPATRDGFDCAMPAYFTGAVSGAGLLNFIYPVGSIYMSVNATNPASLFGGTWEQIKDRFLLAAGDNYSAGATGGASGNTGSAGTGDGGNMPPYLAVYIWKRTA